MKYDDEENENKNGVDDGICLVSANMLKSVMFAQDIWHHINVL